MMKRIYNYLYGIKGIALILYVQFIFFADIYLTSYPEKAKTWLYLIVFVAAVLICPNIMRFISRVNIRQKTVLKQKKDKVFWFGSFLLVSLLAFGLYYIAFCPGGYSVDSVVQYTQAITGKYSDWHPVLHTLLGFALPLALTGGWNGSVVLFQILVFAVACAYAAYTMLRHSNPAYAWVSLIFILINPATTYISMYPWKDVPFAITALLTVTYALNTYFSKGEWLKKPVNTAAVVTVLAFATIFRHNALFFTVPMLIALLLYRSRKAALITAACFISLIVVIEGPLYAVLNVERPGNRQEEMLGVPMSVIAEVAARNPSAMDDDMRTFMYEVAPAETWENSYQIGNFNTAKFAIGTKLSRINDEGALKVVGYMLRCFVISPKEAFSALIATTDMVYTVSTVDSASFTSIYPSIVGNNPGIVYSGNKNAVQILSYTTERLNKFGVWIFWYIGVMNLILITAALSKLWFRRKEEWKRILMVLSMLLYNFGTMLLLSGDDFRLFYYSFVITPALLLLVLREKKKMPVSPAVTEETAPADNTVS